MLKYKKTQTIVWVFYYNDYENSNKASTK